MSSVRADCAQRPIFAACAISTATAGNRTTSCCTQRVTRCARLPRQCPRRVGVGFGPPAGRRGVGPAFLLACVPPISHTGDSLFGDTASDAAEGGLIASIDRDAACRTITEGTDALRRVLLCAQFRSVPTEQRQGVPTLATRPPSRPFPFSWSQNFLLRCGVRQNAKGAVR